MKPYEREPKCNVKGCGRPATRDTFGKVLWCRRHLAGDPRRVLRLPFGFYLGRQT